MRTIQKQYISNFDNLTKNKLTFGDLLPEIEFKDINGNFMSTGKFDNKIKLFIFKYLLEDEELTLSHKYNAFIKKFNDKLSIFIVYQQADSSKKIDIAILKQFKYDKNIKVIVDKNNATGNIFRIPCILCGYQVLSDRSNVVRLSGAGVTLLDLEEIIQRYL